MVIKSIFKNRIKTGVIINLKHKEINFFLTDSFNLFRLKVNKILKDMPVIKVNATLCAIFIKQSNEKEAISRKLFNTRSKIIDQSTNLYEWFHDNIVDCIQNQLSEFSERRSGFALNSIILLAIAINKFEIGNGASSYNQLSESI